MAKSKEATPTYRVTTMLEDGTVNVETIDADPPKKGDSFEYEHSEVRVGQVIKVEALTDDGVEEITELGDLDHALVEPVIEDDVPPVGELADDPVDED